MRSYAVFSLLFLTVVARDPNYALDLQVRDVSSPVDLVHNYRIVSLAWLEYLGRGARSSDQTLDVFYRVVSVPDRLTIRVPVGRATSRSYQPSNYEEKDRIISSVFEQVLYNYLYEILGIRSPVKLHRNMVDSRGVQLSSSRFNRTFVLSFEDPPYGQSRVNRLVTNRRIPFTVWRTAGFSDSLRFRADYNMTEDLVYRYFHNIGHSLGFGHYLGSEDPRDPTRVVAPHRSVMYANYMDARYSARIPLTNDVDQRAMPVILRAYDRLIRDQVERFNEQNFAPALVTLMRAAARLA